MSTSTSTPTIEPLFIGEVAQRILLSRGQRVVLDTDLASFLHRHHHSHHRHKDLPQPLAAGRLGMVSVWPTRGSRSLLLPLAWAKRYHSWLSPQAPRAIERRLSPERTV